MSALPPIATDMCAFRVPMVMSALPPKAEVCAALVDVCYGPIADMPTIELPRPRERLAPEGL
jgi:hypothetical protein